MWPFILSAASTLMSAQSEREAGEAEREAGAADLTSALVSGHFRDEAITEKRNKVLSSMRARAVASGVEMSGSPLEVLMHAAGQAERDLIISRLTTQRNKITSQARGRRGAAQEKGAVGEGLLKVGKQYVTGYKGSSTDTGGERFTDDELKIYGWD
jgi:hypothetical protein